MNSTYICSLNILKKKKKKPGPKTRAILLVHQIKVCAPIYKTGKNKIRSINVP